LTSKRNQNPDQFVVNGMGRREKHLDPDTGPLSQFASDLRGLRHAAGGATYREMSKSAGYSPSALSAAASGANLPSAGVLSAYVRVCGGDVDDWLAKRSAVSATLAQARATSTDTPRAPTRQPRRLPWRQRVAGLTAAAVLGSLATVVPMAVWGAPACLTQNPAHPSPVATCPDAGAANR
jgi:hypothetical protein